MGNPNSIVKMRDSSRTVQYFETIKKFTGCWSRAGGLPALPLPALPLSLADRGREALEPEETMEGRHPDGASARGAPAAPHSRHIAPLKFEAQDSAVRRARRRRSVATALVVLGMDGLGPQGASPTHAARPDR
jgi:hypothetical protein